MKHHESTSSERRVLRATHSAVARPSSSVQWLAIAALLALAVVPVAAAEVSSWGCEKFWAGPSNDNSIEDCLKDQNREEQWTKWLWIPALPALVFVIVFVFYPIVFVCRQGCNLCGGRRRQPGVCCTCDEKEWRYKSTAEKDAHYTPHDHCVVKTPAFIVCILSVGVIIAIIRGASEADKANSYLLEDVKKSTISTLSGLSDQVKTALTNTTSGTYYSPVDSSTFKSVDDIIQKFQDGYNKYVDDYETYVTNAIRIGMNCLGAVPFAFFLLLPIYASRDNCRRIWPWCTTCIYFVFAIVFSLLGVVFLVLAVGFQTSNGEINRQYAREPGVFQWYAKPYCQAEDAFSSMIEGFATAEQQYAADFCQALTQNCSSGTTYNSGTPEINFVCDGLTSSNYASVCTSYSTAAAVLGGMVVKTGSPACTSCTFSTCSTDCATSEQQSSATTTMYLFAATLGFNSAGSIASPLKDCDYILDLGADSVKRGCPALRDSSYLVGFGCFGAAVLFSVGIVVLFKGQKVFYKKRSQGGERKDHCCGGDDDDSEDADENAPTKV